MRFLVIVFLVIHAILKVSAQSAAFIKVRNPIGMERQGELISIPWKQVLLKFPKLDTANFKVVDATNNTELPFQLEHRGEKLIQNLLVQLSVPAFKTIMLAIVNQKPPFVTSNTFGRYIPERKDDFAWENDKIAFRMYGKALEGSNENANGIDVWVKRTNKLIINERYKRGDYHVDHGDGLDYYHVGLTLGAGNLAPIFQDSIYYPQNYHSWQILDNGPLRTTFKLNYDEWNVAGTPVSCSKTISLDAGSQLSRIEVKYSYQSTSPISVVAGIVKRPERGTALMNERNGILAYWEPQHGADGTTGVGVILPKQKAKMKITKKQYLAQTTVYSGKPITYYAGAAWNKADVITNAKEWFLYLENFRKKLSAPLVVE